MSDVQPLRLLFALPGFHREDRGAEIALLAVAEELARSGDTVTVIGSGPPRDASGYVYIRAPAIDRRKFERFPRFPPMRSDTAWEDATFAMSLLRHYRPDQYDAVITCSFPFTHWALRRWTAGRRPLQIFVTQNGDWPATSDAAEFRTFRCDGLVCTNPDIEARNRHRWRTALIPNGVDARRFAAARADRESFGLPQGAPLVLMVSALIPSKRVAEGIMAVAEIPDAHLVVAGDGPLRAEIDVLAGRLLPGRYTRLSLPAVRMPALYRSVDAFLHMSLAESFGNVFVEALAAGLPVVAHDSASLRWIVGERDTLCDTARPDDLVAALRAALAEGPGPADPRVAEFAWPNIAGRYRTFIAELVRNR